MECDALTQGMKRDIKEDQEGGGLSSGTFSPSKVKKGSEMHSGRGEEGANRIGRDLGKRVS